MGLGKAEFTRLTLELWWRTRFRSRVWWGVWQLALPRDKKEIFISTGRKHGGWPQGNVESSQRGTIRLLTRVFRKHCPPRLLPFSQEQHHLHFTRPSPTALRLPPPCREAPSPLALAQMSPHNPLTPDLLPPHEPFFNHLRAPQRLLSTRSPQGL